MAAHPLLPFLSGTPQEPLFLEACRGRRILTMRLDTKRP